MVGLGISRASLVGDDFADRGHRRVAEFEMRGEANEDGFTRKVSHVEGSRRDQGSGVNGEAKVLKIRRIAICNSMGTPVGAF